MSAASTILVADDDRAIRTVLERALTREGYDVRLTSNARTLWSWVADGEGDLVISDVVMPDENGLDLIPRIREIRPDLKVIIMSAQSTLLTAVKANERGAYEYLPKPFDLKELISVIERALQDPSEVHTNAPLDTEEKLPLIGRSVAMQNIYRVLARLMATDLTVLITGESGTGKELVARALHQLSPRATGHFVPINCAALPETLIESELFGHVRGAFTGTNENRIGKFEYATGGTLFLDEIESMPLELQSRLLRVLEDRLVVPLGSNTEIPVDVRVIAATKADLKENAGRSFREDLFYRLNVLTIAVPSLRERRDDILPLMLHFLDQASLRFKRPAPEISVQEITALTTHTWPGNVRELKNTAMRLAVGQGLGMEIIDGDSAAPDIGALADQVSTFEKSVIRACLERHHYRLKPTYEELGVSRKTLYDKIRKYGLEGLTAADRDETD